MVFTPFRICILAHLLITAIFYEKSIAYPVIFQKGKEAEEKRKLKKSEVFVVQCSYIVACFLWPIFGIGLYVYWNREDD